MQTLGYVRHNGEKLLVLARQTRIGVALKLRTSGADGTHFEDEEAWLRRHPFWVKHLKSGEVVYF